MKANNLKLGAIYINATTGQPCRLVTIVPCEGAWLESYDGQGYGKTISFDDVHYADKDDVQAFLDDLHVYEGQVKGHKDDNFHTQRVKNYDAYWNVTGYYRDSEGNDIRCRD